jgi:hypothetical protein
MTPLGNKVNEVMSLALESAEGHAVWRGDLLGEQWKIMISYSGVDDKFDIIVKRRDFIEPRE